MPVDAFGRQSMTLAELREALDDIAKQFPHLLNEPVWADNRDLYKPVRNVLVTQQGRTILEVHHA